LAGLGVYLLLADHEPGAEIVSAAVDREQAGIVFALARDSLSRSLTSRSENPGVGARQAGAPAGAALLALHQQRSRRRSLGPPDTMAGR
jgi:hypothetical protein